MLFRKRRRPPGSIRKSSHAGGARPNLAELISIDFDMMLKGAKVLRKGETVRQYLVMVGATPRLVTSGDQVERAVYEALLAAGVVLPSAPEPKNEAAPDSRERP